MLCAPRIITQLPNNWKDCEGRMLAPVPKPSVVMPVCALANVTRRVRMRLLLRLRGMDPQGRKVDTPATTENVSAGGFLCDCAAELAQDSVFDVFLSGQQERLVGRARIVRVQGQGTAMRRFAMQFSETTSEWIMRS